MSSQINSRTGTKNKNIRIFVCLMYLWFVQGRTTSRHIEPVAIAKIMLYCRAWYRMSGNNWISKDPTRLQQQQKKHEFEWYEFFVCSSRFIGWRCTVRFITQLISESYFAWLCIRKCMAFLRSKINIPRSYRCGFLHSSTSRTSYL